MALRQPKRGVLVLAAGVERLCPTPDHASPAHADFFQL